VSGNDEVATVASCVVSAADGVTVDSVVVVLSGADVVVSLGVKEVVGSPKSNGLGAYL